MPRSLTGRPTTKRENKYQLYKCFSPEGEIFCFCDTEPRLAAVLRTTQTNRNGNLGRQFWACPGTDEQCEFFLWNDQLRENGYVGYLDVADSDWEEQDEDIFGERYGQRLGGDAAGMRTPPPTPQKKKKQPAAAKQNKSKKRHRAKSDDEEDEDEDGSDSDTDVQVTPRSGSKKSSSSKGSSSQKKQKVPIGGSPAPASRRKSPASPAEGPSGGGGAEAEVVRLKREMAAMKRQMQAKDKATSQLAKENEEYRAENSQLLEKAYPELFTPSQGAQG